jgi:hypothetical protein
MRASPAVPARRSFGTSNDTELKRNDDTLAFPSEEQLDLGQCLLDSG